MDRMTKMFLLNGGRDNRSGGSRGRTDYGRRDGGRMEYRGGVENGGYDMRNNYDVDDRFRDRRGREHYDNGRYAPMRNEYDSDRYTIIRGEYDDDHPQSRMNTIGFADTYDRPEMSYSESYGSGMERGYGSGSAGKLTKEAAEEWANNMKNSDGTKGAHWPMSQVKQLIAQRRLDCDPVELFAALNATYSDLSKFFKKYNINNMDAYIDYAKMFWLEDDDSVEDKLANYFMYIVK